jgi:hypothetical protein
MRLPLSALVLLSGSLAACSTWKPPDIAYDDTPRQAQLEPNPPTPFRIVALPKPLPLPGQLKRLPRRHHAPPEPADPHYRVEAANNAARIQPIRADYFNAIQVYPFSDGALYQVYAAPGEITDVAFEAGEKLVEAIAKSLSFISEIVSRISGQVFLQVARRWRIGSATGGIRTPRRTSPTAATPFCFPVNLIASTSAMARLACRNTAVPPAVSRSPLCPRSNTVKPNSSSNRPIRRLIVPVLIPSDRAARLKLPALADAVSHLRSRNFMAIVGWRPPTDPQLKLFRERMTSGPRPRQQSSRF